jgi:hypothetical protein
MEERFYPEEVPPFPYEPTKDKFQIITTDGSGHGIIATQEFEPGDIVFKFTGDVLDEQTLFTLQIKPGSYVHDPYFMGKVLHSCEPNMVCDVAARTFIAVKPIKPFDFITMDYESTEDELYRSFNCCCGAAGCRGFISGRRARVGLETIERTQSEKYLEIA